MWVLTSITHLAGSRTATSDFQSFNPEKSPNSTELASIPVVLINRFAEKALVPLGIWGYISILPAVLSGVHVPYEVSMALGVWTILSLPGHLWQSDP